MLPWLLITLSAGAAADPGACPLRRVVPEDPHAHTVVLGESSEMPRDALVQVRPEVACPSGVGVRLLASNPIYGFHAQPPAPGATICISEAVLQPPGDALWMTRADLQGLHDPHRSPPVGQVLSAIEDTGDCGASRVVFGEDSLPIEGLGPLRPLSADTLTAVWRVQAHAIHNAGV